MTREEWLRAEINRIKEGGTIRTFCTMGTPERIALGFCLGEIPPDRSHRDSSTCSEDCRQDKKRLRRWETSKHKCRACGHGLPKPRKPKKAKELQEIPDSGNGDSL